MKVIIRAWHTLSATDAADALAVEPAAGLSTTTDGAEQGSVFNAAFFANSKLWQAFAGVLALQVVVVHGGPAQSIFATVDLSLRDWGWRW